MISQGDCSTSVAYLVNAAGQLLVGDDPADHARGHDDQQHHAVEMPASMQAWRILAQVRSR
jgi:hypothetical protein